MFFAENKKTKPIRAMIGNSLISRTYSKNDARGSNIQEVKNWIIKTKNNNKNINTIP